MSLATRVPLVLVPAPSQSNQVADSLAVDDSALLAGLKARDHALSGAFYERVRPIVDRTLKRLLGASDGEYEDVAQLALFELVSTIERFRGDCPLDAWISVVSARVVFRTIRRRRVERNLFAQIQLDDQLAATQSHENTVAMGQALARVRLALDQVNRDRAQTFLLHDVFGYDLTEVSQITGVTLAAAQSRLVRGRREIHERIRNDETLARFLRPYTERE